MIRVTQLSDTHFGPDGARTHGGMGHDTDVSFAAVLEHLAAHEPPDLTIVTGDIADHGAPAEYEKAVRHLGALPGPVAIVPGNHDWHAPFEATLPSPTVSMPRTMRVGDWLFVFLDTNHDGRVRDEHGLLHDRPDRIHTNGNLDPADVAWVRRLDAESDARHLFLWGHHPPFVGGAFDAPTFDERFTTLLQNCPKVRGMAAGHVHSDQVLEADGRPVFVCPSLTYNFSLTTGTSLPPGYRTYEFGDDGTVHAVGHLLDDPRWPRVPLPEPGLRYLRGELGWDALQRALGLVV